MCLGHGAELAGEVRLLLRRQGLVAEEDDVMGVPGVADRRHHLGRQGDREVDARDLGADVRGDGVDADRRWRGSPANSAPLLPYIGPQPRRGRRGKGPSMSTDTPGPLLAPPVRNYSPWYQWMARLADTVHEDPLPEGDPDPRGDPGLGRAVPRPPRRAAWGPSRPGCRSTSRRSSRRACDGYRRDKIVFDTEDTMSVPAYLLVPDARVDAATGRGGPRLPRPRARQVAGRRPGAHRHAQRRLRARSWRGAGYVVLAPDLRCFGERLDWNPEDHYACDTNLVHAAMAGWNPLTQNVWDLMRSLDVLAEHPLVDPDRLGMVGISYGGTVTLFTAAVDQRVAAAVVSGYFSSWAESHKMPWNMCGSQILFGMLGRLEHEDLGALVAPRPLLIETGTEDLLFPVAAATESVRRTRLVYDRPGRARTGWCTTSSRAAISGTAPRPCPSSTTGWRTTRRPPPAEASVASGRPGVVGVALAFRRRHAAPRRARRAAPLRVVAASGRRRVARLLPVVGRRCSWTQPVQPARQRPGACPRAGRAPPLEEAAQDRGERRCEDDPAVHVLGGRDRDGVRSGDVHQGEDGRHRGAGPR